jgi:mannosyltransferase OCH1-like enzyme
MYSKASDFMRLWLMAEYGGIYLDTDIECLRSLAPLRTLPFFVGFQRERGFDLDESINSAVIGAKPGHWAAKALLERLIKRDDGSQAPMHSGPRLISGFLREYGLAYAETTSTLAPEGLEPVHVLPRTAFYPYSWEEPADRSRVTPETYAVHHWDGSWVAAWKESRTNARRDAQSHQAESSQP